MAQLEEQLEIHHSEVQLAQLEEQMEVHHLEVHLVQLEEQLEVHHQEEQLSQLEEQLAIQQLAHHQEGQLQCCQRYQSLPLHLILSLALCLPMLSMPSVSHSRWIMLQSGTPPTPSRV